MVKAITKDIEISVATFYMASQSNPRDSLYFFMYEITIENKGDYAVQLVRRHWDIFDSNGESRVVEGEGVVGETPIMQPGELYDYNSGCNLSTEIGKMKGYYTMKRLVDDSEIEICIPEFQLITPGKLN